MIGLSPSAGVRGFGGGLGLDLRLPKGLAVMLEGRVVSTSSEGISLTRIRAALGVGYVPRIGAFELGLFAAAHLEPWFGIIDGNEFDVDPPPLIGAALRVAPGANFELGSVRLRVALPLDLALAVEAGPGAQTVALARDLTASPSVRAGGVELGLGLALAVWIPVYQRTK